jgi:hypothetical protein
MLSNLSKYTIVTMTEKTQDLLRPLCTSCRGITLPALVSEAGYRHLESAHNLPKSAESCAMCSLIQDALHQNKSGKAYNESLVLT